MAKQSSKKSKAKKKAHASSKAKVAKTPKKGVERLPLPYPDLHYQLMFVAAFAEFLSDEINIPYDGFRGEYLRKRYATLLWKYGLDKAKAGYVSDNDDPPRLKSHLTIAT
ncbi:hypothetical protein KY290_009120 [Solanum tuberosum]|uniref:Ulp1 protease family, C-terminal catalytic domain containing protein n=1 Tax=Solanum tuberosum TaxID=4113 RepID=A0ABQ7WAD0_SOLTU|nr:hypothetical protein KY289_007631 [Solanum tuberosum]KAH0777709.1 hypothetical protein KY290_009120 [Solanum tuberosum]